MAMTGNRLSKNGKRLNQTNELHVAMFMLETYAVMKKKCYDGLGTPEPGSHEEKIIVAAIVCQTMIEAGANAHAFYDEWGEMSGFSIDGVNFFLETRKEKLRA